MSEEAQTNPATKDGDGGIDTAQLIYILYLASVLLGITGLIGAIWAFFAKKDIEEEWILSHYEYLIDTFFKGFLYALGSVLLMFVFIGFLLMPLVYVWWIIRSIKGLQRLNKSQPIENPKSWLF